jgi:hypothetical protein
MHTLIVLLAFVSHSWAEPNQGSIMCQLDFKGADSVCGEVPGAPLGKIKRSAVIAIGDRGFFVKFDSTGNRIYQEIFDDKPAVLINQDESAKLDDQYDPKKEKPVTFDCQNERRECGLPDDETTTTEECAADYPAGIKALMNPLEEAAHEAKCTEEVAANLKAHPCDQKSILHIAGDCLNNVLTGAIISVKEAGTYMYHVLVGAVKLPVKGYDLAKGTHYAAKIQEASEEPAKIVEDWWTASETAENKSSDVMAIAAHADEKSLALAAEETKGPEPSPGLLARFSDYMTKSITSSYGCLEWSGTPHLPGSTCVKPWTAWKCADCSAKANLLCGMTGYMIGEIGSVALIGGFFKYLVKGGELTLKVSQTGADGLQSILAKTSSYVPKSEEYSVFGSGVDRVSQGVSKVAKKIDSVKTMTGKYMMDHLRAAGRGFKGGAPPADLGETALDAVQGPSKATNWYWTKLKQAIVRGSSVQIDQLEDSDK